MEWPYIEDDFMEIGETGWISAGHNKFINIKTGHTIDEYGKEYDSNGTLVREHNLEEE